MNTELEIYEEEFICENCIQKRFRSIWKISIHSLPEISKMTFWQLTTQLGYVCNLYDAL